MSDQHTNEMRLACSAIDALTDLCNVLTELLGYVPAHVLADAVPRIEAHMIRVTELTQTLASFVERGASR